MTDVWDQFTPAPEPRRDRWGRYLVLPPAGGKPVGYTRATTIAKVLDDQSSLIDWSKRTTALGLAQRPDLLALVATTDPDDRKALNDLCSKASEAGGATARRDLGTALHSMLERSWFDPNYRAPDAYRGDVDAVRQALADHGFQPMPGLAERLIVNDVLQVAGMFDLALTDGHRHLIADVKTGSSVNYGSLAWAIQLRIYASANNLYTQGAAADGSEDRREPMPGFDQERAVVIHVQPGSGHCELHELDLTVGERGLELAVAVRDIRKTKPIRRLTPVSTDDGVTANTSPSVEQPGEGAGQGPAVPAASSPGTHLDWLRGRVTAIVNAADVDPALLAQYNVATAGELMAAWWPEAVPTLREGGHDQPQLDAIAERASMVEKALGLPFPDPTPAEDADNVRVMGDDPWVLDIIRRLQALPADLLRQVETEAAAAGITAKVSLGLPLGKLRTLDGIVDGIEDLHRCRIVTIDDLLDEFDMPARALLCGHQSPATFTSDDVDRLRLMCDAFACGYLAVADTELVASDRADELLQTVHGNRRDALNHTKRQAKARSLTPPSSFADVLANPLLVALATASDEDATATPAVA